MDLFTHIPHDELRKRINNKTEIQPNGCWNWTGSKFVSGYGAIRIKNKLIRIHRINYELFKGKISKGLVIDHLCRNIICINPDHLEVVTPKINVLRGTSFAVINSKKTHCKRGHEFNIKNTNIKKDGTRRCRECGRIKQAEHRKRIKNVV